MISSFNCVSPLVQLNRVTNNCKARVTAKRRKILQMFGAELIVTPAEERMIGAVNKANEVVAKTNGTFLPQQFNNPA